MMRYPEASAAELSIVQAQDLLGLGHEARMNTPLDLRRQLVLACQARRFTDRLAVKLHDLTELYGRLPE